MVQVSLHLMKLISYLLKTDALKVLYFCSFYYTYTGCRKDCFTEIVECLTLIIFTCVHFFLFAAGDNTGVTPALVSITCVIGKFTHCHCLQVVGYQLNSVFFWNVSITSVK